MQIAVILKKKTKKQQMNLIQRTFIKGTGYDYPDLPGLGNNNEKLGLPERLSTGIQFRFRNLFHGKKSGNRNFIC
jgi:hypothetical protein